MSPGTAKKKQAWKASTEQGEQSIKVVPKAVSLHVRLDAAQPQSAHLEMRQELPDSKQTILTAVNYEKNLFCSFKTKL